MARPTKQGLDYYPLDVQFLSDLKIRKIMRAQGTNSIAVIISLLGNIFKDEGYYILRDEDMSFLISDEVGVKEEYVNEVIDKALQVGFFDQNLYEKFRILTSNGIQKRFFEATERRKETVFNEDFRVNVDNNPVNVVRKPINDNKSTQSRVKESKVEKRKEDEGALPSSSAQKILLAKTISIDQWAMKFRVSPERIRECIPEFSDFKERHAENRWKNESDLTKNFEFWLRSNAVPKPTAKQQNQTNGIDFKRAERI